MLDKRAKQPSDSPLRSSTSEDSLVGKPIVVVIMGMMDIFTMDKEKGSREPFGPTYTSDDTIGAGINYSTQEFFFTKNGELVGIVSKDIRGLLYPTIAVHGPNKEYDCFPKSTISLPSPAKREPAAPFPFSPIAGKAGAGRPFPPLSRRRQSSSPGEARPIARLDLERGSAWSEARPGVESDH
ncbi:hypothetical protein KSP40_PGU002200 [Platanthera guangdongensis]|uniref:SPRY domain-containing protein n=1 Tax=Platanthera guangdongensis TaxID=2320717 RepID=A0ABR2LSG4_9ASPA